MGLGISLPWMLCWLAATVIPLLLALLAMRHPRVVRFGPTAMVARAARRSRLTRSGVPLPLTIVRSLLLACATVAAARPFLPAPVGLPRILTTLSGQAGERLAASNAGAGSKIEILSDRANASADGDAVSPTLALHRAIEALVTSGSSFDALSAAGVAGPPPPTTIALVSTNDAARGPPGGRLLMILCAGAVPGAADAERIAAAVEAGAGLLVCIGPQSLAESDRRRISAWLDPLAGITIEGRQATAAASIEVSDVLAVPITAAGQRPAPIGFTMPADLAPLNGFVALPGPSVMACADIRLRNAAPDQTPASILARTVPGDRPLLVAARHGRGIVCVSALPLTLQPRATTAAADTAAAWSDLAAWPVFVPLVDRLLTRLLGTAAATPPGPDNAAIQAASRSRPPALTQFPLGPALIVIALACALLDWLLSSIITGGTAVGGFMVGRWIAHVAVLASLVAIFVTSRHRPPAAELEDAAGRHVALLLDVSPSMADRDLPAATRDGHRLTRLEAVVDALTLSAVPAARAPGTPGSVLDRLALKRGVRLSTVAAAVTPLGNYPHDATASEIRDLGTLSSSAHASRLADAIETMLDDSDEDGGHRLPDAILIATDGVITTGASWAQAAQAARRRGVPLVAIPVGGDGTDHTTGFLPAGFRWTEISSPRLCLSTEALTIDVWAEAAVNAGPLEIMLLEDIASTAEALAKGVLEPQLDSIPTMAPCRFSGRITVPPGGFGAVGSTLLSPVVSVGSGRVDGESRRKATATTIPVAVTDARIRVLMVENVPRYEWRFLQHLLAADARFEVETCLLAGRNTAGMRQTASLPQSAADWNQYDVVVLGDVSAGDLPVAASAFGDAAADDTLAWEGLRQAAGDDGIGIAWIPGPNWWRNPNGGPTWLPAAPSGRRPLPASGPLTLRFAAASRADGLISVSGTWLPTEVTVPLESFHPEVFAVLQPVSLRPTARILATAVPAARTAAAGEAQPPAVIVDRLGAATVLGQLCETWRWRQNHTTAYENYWRHAVRRLAEPHLLGRLFAATIDIRPLAAEVGEPIRIDVVPTRANADVTNWRLMLESQPCIVSHIADTTPQSASTDARVPRQIALLDRHGTGGTSTATVAGLAPGFHTLRLLPPVAGVGQLPSAPVVRDFIVMQPTLEVPGGSAGTGPLEAAARATGGAVVPLADIATLPETLAEILKSAASNPAQPEKGREPATLRWLSTQAAAHLLMVCLVAACVATWWPSTVVRRQREVIDG